MLYRRFACVAVLTLCALAACADRTSTENDDLRRRKDAAVASDSTTSTIDASSTPVAGVIACYTEGDPSATCTLPIHCCFSDYSSQHDGYCTTDACAWGTETCDGPEDCATGELCCARAIVDTAGVVVGYTIGCSTTACGAPPLDHELCHPATGCSSASASCVTAYGNDNDLPPELYICQ